MEDIMVVSKPNKTKMSNLYVLLILFYVCSCTGTNPISLTWASGESNIALFCQVKNIFLQVEFLHESIPIGAYCQPPHPIPLCTRCKDGSITQDLETNSTILVLNSNVKEYHGTWSCKHGVNRDESELVFISQKDVSCLYEISRLQAVDILALLVILSLLVAMMPFILWKCAVKLRRKLKKQDNEYHRNDCHEVSDIECHIESIGLSDDCHELQDNEYHRESMGLSDDCHELPDNEYHRESMGLSDDCHELQDNEHHRESMGLSDDCHELQDTE